MLTMRLAVPIPLELHGPPDAPIDEAADLCAFLARVIPVAFASRGELLLPPGYTLALLPAARPTPTLCP